MRSSHIAIGIVAALMSGCASGPPQASAASPGASLSGTWEGAFVATTTDEMGAPITFPVNLKLSLEGREAHIFVKDLANDPWVELGPPGTFTVDALGANVVIYELRAGRVPTPGGSRWFETYLIAGTAKDANQLLVHWVRVVNNVDTSVDDPDHAGVSAGDGVLVKKSQ